MYRVGTYVLVRMYVWRAKPRSAEPSKAYVSRTPRTVAMIMDERIRELLDAAADAGQLASVIDEGLGR